MAYTYYIQTGIQTYDSTTGTWIIVDGEKITASTTKSILYYSLDEDINEILYNQAVRNEEQADSEEKYNSAVDSFKKI